MKNLLALLGVATALSTAACNLDDIIKDGIEDDGDGDRGVGAKGAGDKGGGGGDNPTTEPGPNNGSACAELESAAADCGYTIGDCEDDIAQCMLDDLYEYGDCDVEASFAVCAGG